MLDKIVENSKRYKIDKSEMVSAVIAKSNLSTDEIQKRVIEWSEMRKYRLNCLNIFGRNRII